jgi:hypothetical protein
MWKACVRVSPAFYPLVFLGRNYSPSLPLEECLAMGSMQFWYPEFDQLDLRVLSSAYISGIEGIPWAGRLTKQANGFTIQRAIDESGKLSILWPSREFGLTALTTASLRCDAEAYCLPLELARGTLHRVRQRAFEWQRIGVKIPEAYQQLVEAAIAAFVDAVVAGEQAGEDVSRLAQSAIDTSLSAARTLSRAFSHQMLQFRAQQEQRLGTLLGVRLSHSPDWRPHVDSTRLQCRQLVSGVACGRSRYPTTRLRLF